MLKNIEFQRNNFNFLFYTTFLVLIIYEHKHPKSYGGRGMPF